MSSSRVVCVYLNVKEMERSIHFYSQLLKLEVEAQFKDRWAQFKISNDIRLGLLNPGFDRQVISGGEDLEHHYDETFIQYVPKKVEVGNSVVLNLLAEDLEEEYARIQSFCPMGLTEIMYVNFMMPYHCFRIQDPDGNWIEIADV